MQQNWERLAGGVHRCRLDFLDVTVGVVVGSAGTVVIDCGTTLAEATSVADDIGTGLGGGPVTHLVLTHDHFDHIMGASVFAAARVYCAPEVAATLTSGADRLRAEAIGYGAAPGPVDATLAALRAPADPATGGVIDIGDRTVEVLWPGRGHTDHDLIVVVAPRDADDPVVVFCGDLVEESGDPAVGPDSDVARWPATLDRVLAVGGPTARYVPGHGAVVDADFVARQRDWLATTNRC
ncbi:MAG: MBL fold metallo-hydrolase [Mycobacterium sp.]|nr:MBL fold metallo-hydrolase [Mycobacterium sp.]